MNFTLVTDGGDTETNFTGDAKFHFNDAGLLVILSEGVRRIYSPNGWVRLEQPIDPNESSVYVL